MAEISLPYSRSIHADLLTEGKHLLVPLRKELTPGLFDVDVAEIRKIYRCEPPEEELWQPICAEPGVYGWHRFCPKDGEFGDRLLSGLMGFRNMYKEAEILKRFKEAGVPNVPYLTSPIFEHISYLGRGTQIFPVRQVEFGVTPVYGRVATEFSPLGSDLVVKQAIKILNTLEKAKQLGVEAHNDLHPGNLIIGEKDLEITVLDWGAATLKGAPEDVELANEEFGSLVRMISRRCESKTDIISIAKIMLYWLSGGDSSLEINPPNDVLNYAVGFTQAYQLYLRLYLAGSLEEAATLIESIVGEAWPSQQVACYYEAAHKARMNKPLAELLLKIIQIDYSAVLNYPQSISLSGIPDIAEFRQQLVKCMY